MKRYCLFAALLVLTTIGCAKQPEITTPKLVKFTAQKSAVRLSGKLPDSEKPTVTIEAKAVVYNPAIVIQDITTSDAQQDVLVGLKLRN